MTSNLPTILIILGITGDLAKRKLLPAIEAIAKTDAIPDKFQIVGITRQANIDVESVLADVKNPDFVRGHLTLFKMDVNNEADYQRLLIQLEDIEKRFGVPAQRLFYLSVPPRASLAVVEMLGKSGLAKIPNTKLLLEKPFGVDLPSAVEMVEHIGKYFASEQVYRIDHYAAKEMAQNLIVFRERNSLFRRTWNNAFIDRIEILASESISIEGRADFYEQTGALRDLVQSHLLQLAALVVMEDGKDGDKNRRQESPEGNESTEDALPRRRLAALKSLSVSRAECPLGIVVRRGQYEGYRSEVNNPESVTETYVSVTLESADPRFIGVPITLTTGKGLAKKATEIRIFYKQDHPTEANELLIRLQPNEAIIVPLWLKRPGYEKGAESVELNFTYANHPERLAEAYEQIFVDAMRSDQHLFISSDEVLESWRIIKPIQEVWSKSSDDLLLYKTGSELPLQKLAL